MSVMQQNPDGSWSPAEPIGWQEEHGPLARLLFRARGIEHCNDREGQRRRTRLNDRHTLWLWLTGRWGR
jgi:hypothetical protein